MNGSLRSWIHYCQLRMANGTQAEHMEIAQLAWNILEGHFPNTTTAVRELDKSMEYSTSQYTRG